MSTVFRIRDIAAEIGKKQRGYLTVGETPMGPIQIPLLILHGAKPGPTLCLTAGVHAAEYPAIDAVLRTVARLDPADLSGTVVAVPVVNSPMFRARSAFLSPIDGLNLNRTFPGKPKGTISEVIADLLLNEVVARADFHIDCHGGDLPEVLWPYSGYAMTGNPAVDERGEAMARLYSPRIVALYRDGTALPPTRGSLTSEAARRGVASILAESGSAGGLEPSDVDTHMHGIQNVMRFFKMLPGEPVIHGRRMLAVGQFVVDARRGGLLRLAIGIGDEIKEGQAIAEVCDVFGDVVERIVSPANGIARIIWTHKAVNTGDPILKCWRVEPAPAFAATDGFVRDSV
ncbi:MAG TPA: succinylglutamate desuccinylase/aspartoacylase family protein [Candidatus Methylomirabilis sp.]|nr:succinylglutamate desuccinylase/aspartoacylase family protein [Candidatus Methylomirabilis sp.]